MANNYKNTLKEFSSQIMAISYFTGREKPETPDKENNSLRTSFVITDFEEDLLITYEGILPDLFSEEAGIVAKGKINDEGTFIANEVLAKHDENYMPPEVAKTLKDKK